MSDKIDPLLIPAVVDLLLKRIARDARDPPQFPDGATLIVTKTIAGKHQWDCGMAGGLATVTLEPGDVVACLGRGDSWDLTVLPITDNVDAFIKRAVSTKDQPYVVRHHLVVNLNGSHLREYFSVKDEG